MSNITKLKEHIKDSDHFEFSANTTTGWARIVLKNKNYPDKVCGEELLTEEIAGEALRVITSKDYTVINNIDLHECPPEERWLFTGKDENNFCSSCEQFGYFFPDNEQKGEGQWVCESGDCPESSYPCDMHKKQCRRCAGTKEEPGYIGKRCKACMGTGEYLLSSKEIEKQRN